MINGADIRKTYYYLKKNGLKNTCYALCERLTQKQDEYRYAPILEKERTRQKETIFQRQILFSILVPMYETNPAYAGDMIRSVLEQTYPNFELILADASDTEVVLNVVRSFHDSRIRYVHLDQNAGISENTNCALMEAKGDYAVLLDHDDLITQDALYEASCAIQEVEKRKKKVAWLYSDEDKCDGSGKKFYEPNIKPEFNLDLLLSNNYICHLVVMDMQLLQKLKFRKSFDGAQDHDLLLRAYRNLGKEEEIFHIPKVLYHWRCHEQSTAANPQSKRYAYEAGKRAVEDYLLQEGIKAKVFHTNHNGFYRIEYEHPDSIWKERKDIGIIAGPIWNRNKITGGIYDINLVCPYRGLHKGFSGYLHRGVLQQDALTVDIRNMKIRRELLKEVLDVLKNIKFNDNLTKETLFQIQMLVEKEEWKDMSNVIREGSLSEDIILMISTKICQRVRKKGYLIYWDPFFEIL